MCCQTTSEDIRSVLTCWTVMPSVGRKELFNGVYTIGDKLFNKLLIAVDPIRNNLAVRPQNDEFQSYRIDFLLRCE